MSPRRGSKPRRTDRLVVGRNVTLTFGTVLRLYKGGLPGRGVSPLLRVFAFRLAPRKRKSIGQVNPNCNRMKLLRAAETPQQRQARLEQKTFYTRMSVQSDAEIEPELQKDEVVKSRNA
jgi:hypothetical protein